jgi:hypothetical protein
LPSDVYRIDNADTATATATSTSDTWHSLGAEDLPRRLDEPASGTVRGT